MRRIVTALLLLTSCAVAQAAEEAWYSVHLDGRKIGHMRSLRDAGEDGRIRHEQRLVLELERNGQALRISSDETSWETPGGAPLSFRTEIDTAGSVTRTRGELRPDGMLALATELQGRTHEHTMPWPAGALMAEGLRLAAERAGFAPGTQHELLNFDPGSLQAIKVRTRVGSPGSIEVHGRSERLLPLEQTLEMGGVPTHTRSWITPDTHELRRVQLPAIGLQLEMLACDRACALAPVQPTDVLASTTVAAPQALTPRQLGRPLRYRLRLERGDGQALAQVPGQTLSARNQAGEFDLVVDPRGDAEPRPRAEDLGSNRWLQADAEEVVALAREAVRGARGEAAQVEQLERFVRGYIDNKSLRIGYASAREIIAGREGDCTEHAVLLAALVRALGIPARVATGIAYAPVFGARRDVFVPHAWVNAWVDGEWRGYDAALARFDAGHIAFSTGDGDPYRFYGGIELLGAIDIVAVERARGSEEALRR